jgi:ankyrin repeat protein
MRWWLLALAACHVKPAPEKVATAVRKGDDAELVRLLDDGADPNAAGSGETEPLLTIALIDDREKTVEILLAHHADPNRNTIPSGYSSAHGPLYYAALHGNVPAVRALVAAGARVDGDDGAEVTPLVMAAEEGHVEAVDALIALHANVDGHGAPGHGYPPLASAAERGHLDCVRHLLAAHAQIDRRDSLGMTALSYACAQEHVDIVEALLDAHADPLIANRAGWTPAYTCFFHNKEAPMRARGVKDFAMHAPVDTDPSGYGTITVPVVEVKAQ